MKNKYFINTKASIAFKVIQKNDDDLTYNIEWLTTGEHPHLKLCNVASKEFIDECEKTTEDTWKSDLIKYHLKKE